MTIYIDKDFKCHHANDGTMVTVESAFFDGMCAELIECYRYVPEGETWTREDGVVFSGEMITLHTDATAAMMTQSVYEKVVESAGDYVAAYEEGVQSA